MRIFIHTQNSITPMIRFFKGIFTLIQIVGFLILGMLLAIGIVECMQQETSDNTIVKTGYLLIEKMTGFSEQRDKEEINNLLDDMEEDEDFVETFNYKRCDDGVKFKIKDRKEICVDPDKVIHGKNYGRDIQLYICGVSTCEDDVSYQIKRISINTLEDSLKRNSTNACFFATRYDMINLQYYESIDRRRIGDTKKYEYTIYLENGAEVSLTDDRLGEFKRRLSFCNISH